MPIDMELSEIPKQTVIGDCVDCDTARAVTRNGKCSTCGSDSVLRRGAIKEMKPLVRLRAIRLKRELQEEKARAKKAVTTPG